MMIHNSRKLVTKKQQDNLWLIITTTQEIVLKGRSIRKAEDCCSKSSSQVQGSYSFEGRQISWTSWHTLRGPLHTPQQCEGPGGQLPPLRVSQPQELMNPIFSVYYFELVSTSVM